MIENIVLLPKKDANKKKTSEKRVKEIVFNNDGHIIILNVIIHPQPLLKTHYDACIYLGIEPKALNVDDECHLPKLLHLFLKKIM